LGNNSLPISNGRGCLLPIVVVCGSLYSPLFTAGLKLMFEKFGKLFAGSLYGSVIYSPWLINDVLLIRSLNEPLQTLSNPLDAYD